jgi:hypothetical protein
MHSYCSLFCWTSVTIIITVISFYSCKEFITYLNIKYKGIFFGCNVTLLHRWCVCNLPLQTVLHTQGCQIFQGYRSHLKF